MCGIAGILGRDDRPLVRRMLDAIAHRGPDGEGVWADATVTLGHRRLAIVDIATGQQPMQDTSGRFAITYNGEIYNHVALRAELELLGARFRTASDTEVILEGWRVWGSGLLARLEGMFAFALWDTQERRLVLARDPWGQKPLYYCFVGGQLTWASEQKALFAGSDLRPRPDLDRFREQAVFEFVTGNGTLFQDVRQLPPGTWARVGPNSQDFVPQPYPSPPRPRLETTVQAAREIRLALVESVREQLMGEVPIGVVLSGGIDSASVAAIHQSFSSQPIQTFTIAESQDVHDVQAARKVATHLGTEHHETTFTFDDMVRDLPRHAWHNENTNYTEFFFLPLFAAMKTQVSVGLCGQGADELWGGYARYQDPQALATERRRRLARAAPAHATDLAKMIDSTHASGDSLARWDQKGQLGNFQLRLVDRNAMAQGLEVRAPFLSRTAQALSKAVPWDWKVRDGVEKWVLRKAMADLGLPPEIIARKKVPAGRATSPGIVQQFETLAQRLRPPARVEAHPMAGAFQNSAECLMYDLWHEVFIERQGRWQGLALEDLA